MFSWYAREKWGSQFSPVACEDCLEVYFVGLVLERISVWCLAIVVILWALDKQQQIAVRYASKSSVGGGDASHKRGVLIIGKAGSQYAILLYCETLLQVLLGIYCKRFYWIPLFTILLLFYVFEVSKAKSATQSPNDINTECAIPEKFSKFLLYL